MLKRIIHMFLLTMLVFSALWVAGQPAVPDNVCVGTTKKYWVAGSPGSTFTWRINGVIQTALYPDTLFVTWASPWVPSPTPYVVTVQEQNLQGCVGEVMSSVVVVLESVPVSVGIAGANPVCSEVDVTYTATPVNGGTNPGFSWFVNGIEMQNGSSPTYTYTPIDGDLVYVVLASSETCAANSPALSSTITMMVSPLLLVEVSVTAGASPVCAGTEVRYTATPVNGGPNPVFSWFVNGVMVQNGSLDYYSYVPVNGDELFVSLTSDALCTINATVNSEMLITDVLPLAAPQFNAIGPLCQNTAPPTLPGVSVNGISGSWDPAIISTTTAGTFTFTFTPDAGQCAEQLSITVTIDSEIPPLFDVIPFLCVNSTPPLLAGTSLNGITGTWDPSVINTAAAGTTTFTFTPDAGQCAAPYLIDITVTDPATPLFDPFGLLCLNSVPPVLPDVSTNGINGTWDPLVISTGIAGTFTYTFTPDAGECAVATTVGITVSDEVVPQFDLIGPLCLNSTPPALQGTSLNGVTGTWNPPVINTGSISTTTYFFFPDNGQCAIEYRMDITVTDQILPIFDLIGPLCFNSTAPLLPAVSLNGIAGTWNPANINTGLMGTFTYTFTPDGGQCGIETSTDITVTDQIMPAFDPMGPLCINSTPPALPDVSLNGIAGNWNPATINTGAAGTITYTFTPSGDQCGLETTLDITVTDQIIPAFEPIGPICINSVAPALPASSPEGITGTWLPAIVNTGALGTTTYIFTPDGGQCAVSASLDITITDGILPLFDPIGPICQNSAAPALPDISVNGITGTWFPAAINTTVPGTTTYTFTPDSDQCGLETTLDIIISDEINPLFTPIGPLCIGSTPPALPFTSGNGITGTWNPATINTGAIGTTTYVFTPDAGQCGTGTTMDIVITDEITPVFNAMGPYCFNAAAPLLPLTSVNGITGSWVPAAINTLFIGTTTYVFTPGADQCATGTTLDITVTDQILPVFTPIGPLCLGSTPPSLPLISDNGITGSWIPATINTGILGTSTYAFTPADGQCSSVFTMDITITNQITPVFTPIGPLCHGSTPPSLPLISDNGITGSWIPATINTGILGTSTYTFTPADGQCSSVFTMDITITNQITPVFTPIGPLCLGSTPPSLPLISDNGITGSWIPATINTGILGTSTYTFTPAVGQCSSVFTMDITITNQILPVFTPIGPLCLGSTPPSLPLISDNGIIGVWIPATINTGILGTSTYTFTPAAGQCSSVFTMDITITNQITPVFTPIGPLCLGSTPPSLPLISDNGITGSWIPATINTGTLGISTYTFTPAAGQCSSVFTMDITITDQITPVFTQIGPLCLGSTPPSLPLISDNGITGSWIPVTINTAVLGTSTYTFTPADGQCSSVFTMDITITNQITPVFTPIGPLCLGSTPPSLPLISDNGITGSWIPVTINTGTLGTSTYIFTPADGQCSSVFTMDITITNQITPVFTPIGPLCLGSTPPSLPLISDNGITGSWIPATINTGILGISTYTFTPAAGQCSSVFTMDITIINQIMSVFTPIGPLCLGSTPPSLPLISDNGITGSWIPAIINTGTLGISTYTFTPDAGQCSVVFTMDITITNQITPVFTPIGPLCLGSSAPSLPLISDNGITGSWIPAIINTGTLGISTYTFTPDAGQCSSVFTMDITITDQFQTTFASIGPFCRNSTPTDLPAVSSEGYTGTWTPAVINTATIGNFTYTFKPDPQFTCAAVALVVIEVRGPSFVNLETTPATNGLVNGKVNIIANGEAPLEYQVDGSGWLSGTLFTGLSIGAHTAYVRDVNGCIEFLDFIIGNLETGEVVISASNSEYCMNLPVIIPVDAENFTDIASFEIELRFDPAILSFNGLTNVNGALNAGTFSVTVSGNLLNIRYSVVAGSATVPNGVQLFGLSFTALAPGNSDLNWNSFQYMIYTGEGYEMLALFAQGQAQILPSPSVLAGGGGVFCEGDSTMLSVSSNDQQVNEYLWSGPDGFSSSAINIDFPELSQANSGNYTVVATNDDGCTLTIPLSLEVNPSPVFSIAQSDSLCAGTAYILDAGSGFESYLWQDGRLTQTYEARDAGQYTVHVVNAYNCSGESSVWLVPCMLELTMPSAFTPNSDNLNDAFRPVLEGDVQPSRFNMLIYNKWGELIYETNDYSAGWDGMVRGTLAPAGVYVFVVSFEVPGYINTTLKSPVHGTVTLLR